MRFENKTVIITGAGQGIGRAYAQEFAKAGAAVVVADLNIDKAQAVAAEIQAENGQALAVKVDVSDDKSTAEMVAQAVKAFGTVDVLINNAAVFSTLKMKPFEEIDANEWDFVMGVNARGVFNCAKAVSPFMKQQQSGKIINISSSVVVTGRANYAHYVASKGAVVALTRALATELGEYGINVNAISPHGIVTEVPRDTIRPEQWDAIIAAQTLKRKGDVSDMIGATMFLACDESKYITGQTLNVDAGLRFN
ncbi:SDR family NAD(P)-dependent oxidoreductase [Alcaligenes aquatilis]|uniref:Dehydrogenase n=2 Tax=Alcaligenes TaxID=507 RepID=A0AB33CTY6_ALCFA|nr:MULTISPECIES: glucose 1-dehydrogenase [Alcaligenes]ASR89816.1 dehydrogenase [Alcaligenes faecalis]AYR19574.1 glucose 1-dehydrogenase [Alcaligenes faecalis]UQN34521.1 glucose 1-dehydrogenase [Alcaligenes aquatilis]UYY85702.1 glucose 1-dehydrogenase [Alcaligenes sp. SMD-FA]HBQ88325.1 3-oxoacyl-ACP reductase [Alcaligenes faecalis]